MKEHGASPRRDVRGDEDGGGIKRSALETAQLRQRRRGALPLASIALPLRRCDCSDALTLRGGFQLERRRETRRARKDVPREWNDRHTKARALMTDEEF